MMKWVKNLKVKKTSKFINEAYDKFIPNKRFDNLFKHSPRGQDQYRYKINLDPEDSDKEFGEILSQYACNLPGNTTELAFAFSHDDFMLRHYSIQRNAIYFEKQCLCYILDEYYNTDEGLYAYFNKDIILNSQARQTREDICKIIQFFNHFLNKEYYAMIDRKKNATLNALYNKK